MVSREEKISPGFRAVGSFDSFHCFLSPHFANFRTNGCKANAIFTSLDSNFVCADTIKSWHLILIDSIGGSRNQTQHFAVNVISVHCWFWCNRRRRRRLGASWRRRVDPTRRLDSWNRRKRFRRIAPSTNSRRKMASTKMFLWPPCRKTQNCWFDSISDFRLFSRVSVPIFSS